MKQIKSLNSFLAQNVLKLTSFHSFERAKRAREKNQHFISSSQNTCYNTYFGPKFWNSLTFPWLSWYLKFPWPSCKKHWLFPDLEEKSNFPDFSLTSGYPVIIILQDKRFFTNTVLLKQIPKQSQQLSELLFKTTAANKRWYLKQKKFDLRFTKCTSYAEGKAK